ncbi:thiopurine S-methyltransferase [Pseudomonas fluorescens HK44]|uniref:Thiopurine S-methyltransferase n=1 Tax=Pseudomonas fluorescens HK44 TaxID=1042209 RepID=A0A010SNA9_PSEFL|nr:thiopurine S-methyltransferase [Pseudomonas fluorescens]EXF92628.1 thiopurine S-methyltransferase [Pseudomonas fluorescens HK44]
MQPEFWQKRWELNQIGFHQSEVNPYLQQYWPQLNLTKGSQVLVPLCGKSLDLVWLAGQGHRVLGVELSEKAVEEFFREQQLTPQITEQGAFKVYQAGSLVLWCGDFFSLTADDVVDCVAVYDRAALIALPPPMREQYAAHLSQTLPATCEGLLITMDYDQAQLAGPPFAVTDEDVQTLLGGRWRLDFCEVRDILGESWKFLQAGVTRLEERVYKLIAR